MLRLYAGERAQVLQSKLVYRGYDLEVRRAASGWRVGIYPVDGPASTLRVLAPIRDQAPLEQVERALARLVVLANDQKLLARRSVVARADVVRPPVGNSKTIDDSEAKRFGALDDAATHWIVAGAS